MVVRVAGGVSIVAAVFTSAPASASASAAELATTCTSTYVSAATSNPPPTAQLTPQQLLTYRVTATAETTASAQSLTTAALTTAIPTAVNLPPHLSHLAPPHCVPARAEDVGDAEHQIQAQPPPADSTGPVAREKWEETHTDETGPQHTEKWWWWGDDHDEANLQSYSHHREKNPSTHHPT